MPRRRADVSPVRLALGVLGELMITTGLLLFAFVGWQLFWTDVVANRSQADQVSALERDFARPDPNAPSIPANQRPKPVPLGQAFALVRIPRFGSDYVRPVNEGTTLDILKEGIGHYAGTALPGQVGNFATAGHRTTYGKPYSDIADLENGDLIVVETKTAYDVYAVTDHEIVVPTALEVVAPVPGKPGTKPTKAVMTMTSCHPKFSAAQRYIVHAALKGTYSRAAGLPAGTLSPPSGD